MVKTNKQKNRSFSSNISIIEITGEKKRKWAEDINRGKTRLRTVQNQQQTQKHRSKNIREKQGKYQKQTYLGVSYTNCCKPKTKGKS